ncbi:hypothetical protein GAY30_27305, partial [Azospirillum brasilense]|uniref:LamB/YcsF family protein n=1 Tax=Azospirillum brasilense TaxID=192 RepID=UPI00157B3ECF
NGNSLPRGMRGAWGPAPDGAAVTVRRLRAEGGILWVPGTPSPGHAHPVCVHGDEPSAVAMAGSLRWCHPPPLRVTPCATLAERGEGRGVYAQGL